MPLMDQELRKNHPSRVTIRPYHLDDLENVVQLWYRTWHQTFPHLQHQQPYTTWKSRFHDDLAVRGDIWVALVENSIVGFVVVMRNEQYLDQIFVELTFQNMGIGEALLEKAKTICPQGLTLHTLQQNTQARTFYEKHGFRVGKLGINKVNGQTNMEYQWEPKPLGKSP